MIYLASYKGRRKNSDYSLKAFYNSFQDALIRLLTKGVYSHCEIAILRADGRYDCYSASIRDGGVRHKVMRLPTDRWDLQAIDHLQSHNVLSHYRLTKRHRYDTLGALGVVFLSPQSHTKSFCSEWCYNVIFHSTEGWRFSPSDLTTLIQDQFLQTSLKPLKMGTK